MQNPEKTKVLFRIWEDEVLAIFPELNYYDYEDETKWSYQHIGQHGGCAMDYILENSVPATPEQYQDLKLELENQGYNLLVKE